MSSFRQQQNHLFYNLLYQYAIPMFLLVNWEVTWGFQVMVALLDFRPTELIIQLSL